MSFKEFFQTEVKPALMQELGLKNSFAVPNIVKVVLNVGAGEAVTNKGVIAMDAEGKEQVIKADTVILAAGFQCNNPLEKRLKGMVPKVYAIGDCVKPGKIEGAIGAAWRVARKI